MNRFRVLMMLTAFLASTAAGHAQPQPPRYFPPSDPVPVPTGFRAQEAQSGCPATTWYFQAMQETAATWQRLRAVCSVETCGETQAPNCVLGVAGSVKGCEAAQTPKACCCAKACACCETCKAKDTVCSGPRPAGDIRLLSCLPPQCGSGIVQILPVQNARVQVVQVAHAVKPVRLVTPDLEAVCERMHHHGDIVVLEGNVLLLCKKHAQPIRDRKSVV